MPLGVLVHGAWHYPLTAEDYRAAHALVMVEGGRSSAESSAILGTALRRFALRKQWSSFARFVEAYQGGPPAEGSRRAQIYALQVDNYSKSIRDVVDDVFLKGAPLAGWPAEHWGAVSLFPPLKRAVDAATTDAEKRSAFARTVESATATANGRRYVNVPGTVPPRSNVFQSTPESRATPDSAIYVRASTTLVPLIVGIVALGALALGGLS